MNGTRSACCIDEMKYMAYWHLGWGGGGPCRLVHVVPGRNTRLISNTEVIYHHTIHTYLLNSVSSARRTIKTPLNALRQTAAPSARPPAIITNNTRYVVYADGVRCNSSPRCLRLAMVEEWRFPGTQIIMYFIERLWLSPGGAVLLRLSYHVVVIDNKYIVSIGPCRVSRLYEFNGISCQYAPVYMSLYCRQRPPL